MGYTRSSADWDGHVFVAPVVALVPPDAVEPWRGTARELLALAVAVPGAAVTSAFWPKSPSAVTHWLSVISRAIGRRGVEVTIISGAPSVITLRRVDLRTPPYDCMFAHPNAIVRTP